MMAIPPSFTASMRGIPQSRECTPSWSAGFLRSFDFPTRRLVQSGLALSDTGDASQQGPPSAPAWGTASFEGGGLVAPWAARHRLAQLDCMGDNDWELNISHVSAVVFYSSVVR
jgi:hypothetical protein